VSWIVLTRISFRESLVKQSIDREEEELLLLFFGMRSSIFGTELVATITTTCLLLPSLLLLLFRVSPTFQQQTLFVTDGTDFAPNSLRGRIGLIASPIVVIEIRNYSLSLISSFPSSQRCHLLLLEVSVNLEDTIQLGTTADVEIRGNNNLIVGNNCSQGAMIVSSGS